MGLSVGGDVILFSGSGGGSATTLEDLSDVDIVNPQSGQYLRYNSSLLLWQNSFLNTDVFDYLNASMVGVNGVTVTPDSGLQNFTFGLSPTGVSPGTYNTLTVNSFGRVSSASNTSYLTGNQVITLSGDVTGTGTTGISTSLKNSGVIAGTYTKVNVDSKGIVTFGQNPTTLAGFGIVDAQPLNSELTGLSSLAGLGFVARTGTSTYTERTITGTSGRITVTDGAGTSGNPTLDLSTIGTAGTYNNVVVDAWGRVSSGTNVGYLTSNQTISITGDATGSGATSIGLTLANTAVTPGTYPLATITVDSKGRITSASAGSSSSGTVTSVSATGANGVIISGSPITTSGTINIGLGAITPTSVAASGTISGSNFSGSSSGTNTGNQTITLTGGVTGSGTGTFAATVITNANLTGDVTSIGNATTLSNTGVSPGSYTNSNITVDSKGRITSISNGSSGSSGTVTSVSIVTANGVSGSVATATTTPAVTITLGNITPTSVAASGNVSGVGGTFTGTVNAATFNSTSTARVKSDIRDLSFDYLSKFSQLRPREYDRKDHQAHEFGFIAEEISLVYPEVVSVDSTGNALGVDYGKLSTILTAKIQEQQKLIEHLIGEMAKITEMLHAK